MCCQPSFPSPVLRGGGTWGPDRRTGVSWGESTEKKLNREKPGIEPKTFCFLTPSLDALANALTSLASRVSTTAATTCGRWCAPKKVTRKSCEDISSAEVQKKSVLSDGFAQIPSEFFQFRPVFPSLTNILTQIPSLNLKFLQNLIFSRFKAIFVKIMTNNGLKRTFRLM